MHIMHHSYAQTSNHTVKVQGDLQANRAQVAPGFEGNIRRVHSREGQAKGRLGGAS